MGETTKTSHWVRVRAAVGVLCCVSGGIATTAGAAGAAPPGQGSSDLKVTICHRTASKSNPYTSVTVDVSAIDGEGGNDHSSHTGPVGPTDDGKWGDIIPPNDSLPNGLNWNADGRAIYNNGCDLPASATTTTSSTTSTTEAPPVTEATTSTTTTTTEAPPVTEATTTTTQPEGNSGQLMICHRTDDPANPYEAMSVYPSEVNGDDHADHTGPIADGTQDSWGDIIPAIEGHVEGLNWTELGQAIWNNGCEMPEQLMICHATDDPSNPYRAESVYTFEVDGDDHADHTGPIGPVKDGGWGDIIPAIEGHVAGLNWTEKGQAIWNNGCELPKVVETTTTTSTTSTTTTTVPKETTSSTTSTTSTTAKPATTTTSTTSTTVASVATVLGTSVTAPSTTAAAVTATTQAAVVESSTLATTGGSSATMVVLGLVGIALGSILLYGTRRLA